MRRSLVLVATAATLAACGSGDGAEVSTTDLASATPSTTSAPTTTTSTTTTTIPPTTTTTMPAFEVIGPTLVRSIRDIATLSTVEVVAYTTIEKGNDQGWLNWARGEQLSMFAVARIGAGIDLDLLGVNAFDVDTDSGAVTVRLPDSQITYVTLDNDATHVYDRDTGLFTKGDPNLERDARAAAETVLVDQALEEGILLRAQTNAELFLSEFLLNLGYTRVEFVD